MGWSSPEEKECWVFSRSKAHMAAPLCVSGRGTVSSAKHVRRGGVIRDAHAVRDGEDDADEGDALHEGRDEAEEAILGLALGEPELGLKGAGEAA